MAAWRKVLNTASNQVQLQRAKATMPLRHPHERHVAEQNWQVLSTWNLPYRQTCPSLKPHSLA